MGFTNTMAPGVFEGILLSEHEKTFHHGRFSRKRASNSLKIAELNTDVLEPSLLSEIDN